MSRTSPTSEQDGFSLLHGRADAWTDEEEWDDDDWDDDEEEEDVWEEDEGEEDWDEEEEWDDDGVLFAMSR